MPDGQEAFDRASQYQGYSTPKPDPTLLTTEQLMREITRLESSVALHLETAKAELGGQIALTEERFGALRRALDERYATQQFAIQIASTSAEKAKEDAKELFEAKLESMREMLNERYATQTKALDAAFLAQQAAVATSFDASEKAMAAALLAAKEAVEKANVANDKRFDAVNEFRQQLADMQNTLIPRNEADAKFSSIEARLIDMKSTVDKGFTGVNVRRTTSGEGREESRANMAMIIAVISVALSMVFTLVTVLHVVH
jgi:hypothetical protein